MYRVEYDHFTTFLTYLSNSCRHTYYNISTTSLYSIMNSLIQHSIVNITKNNLWFISLIQSLNIYINDFTIFVFVFEPLNHNLLTRTNITILNNFISLFFFSLCFLPHIFKNYKSSFCFIYRFFVFFILVYPSYFIKFLFVCYHRTLSI